MIDRMEIDTGFMKGVLDTLGTELGEWGDIE